MNQPWDREPITVLGCVCMALLAACALIVLPVVWIALAFRYAFKRVARAMGERT